MATYEGDDRTLAVSSRSRLMGDSAAIDAEDGCPRQRSSTGPDAWFVTSKHWGPAPPEDRTTHGEARRLDEDVPPAGSNLDRLRAWVRALALGP